MFEEIVTSCFVWLAKIWLFSLLKREISPISARANTFIPLLALPMTVEIQQFGCLSLVYILYFFLFFDRTLAPLQSGNRFPQTRTSRFFLFFLLLFFGFSFPYLRSSFRLFRLFSDSSSSWNNSDKLDDAVLISSLTLTFGHRRAGY